ncbi:HAD-IB family phosphatase [Candidatus Woesearchaeota archaeon]|nr:HAD-IB family phosphatase [Candidatus Woesearchaeota archaeon]
MNKIAFIDLEGTLINLGNWEKIAGKFGAADWYKDFLKRYEEGRVSYEEGRRDLEKIWSKNKVTKEQIIDVLKNYKAFEGTKELIEGLKKKGYKIVVITGAISVLAELVKEDFGIDEVFSAREFIFDENGFFQRIEDHPTYRRGEGKILIIQEIIEREGADKKDCIAIGGDDINDYWMMKEMKSFAVNPHLNRIKEVVDYNVDKLIDILEFV